MHTYIHTLATFLAFAETQEPRIATRTKVWQQIDDKDQIRSGRLILYRNQQEWISGKIL